MRRVILLSVLALVATGPRLLAGSVLRTFEWKEIPQGVGKVAVELRDQETEGFTALKITNDLPEAVTLSLATIDSPGITSAQFAVRGRVKYADTTPGSYLEMWTFLGETECFFSRTVGGRGPMAPLNDNSDWRMFILPFRIVKQSDRPRKLVVNLAFAGSGVVWVGPLELVEYDASEDMLRLPGQWWGPRAGGLIGAFLGTLFGVCGATVGFLCRRGKGRGRKIILVMSTNVLVLGTGALVLTVVAFLRQQPYVVWFPLLLTGILGAGLPLLTWFPLRQRFADVEFRMNSSGA